MKQINFDYISDLHLDTWIHKENTSDIKHLLKFILPEKPNTTLVIAGDFGHKNTLTYKFLRECKNHYENIICTLGNHDYYLVYSDTPYKNSFERVDNLKNKLTKLDNVYLLDKEIVTIDGTTYGGCTGWCDASYGLKELKSNIQQINKSWYTFADAVFYKDPINPGNHDWKALNQEHKSFLWNNTEKCDVFVTHYIPVWVNIAARFKNHPISTFFHFDGYDINKKFKGKAWVYGHTHDSFNYEYCNTRFLCNPLGYKGEFGYYGNTNNFMINSFSKKMYPVKIEQYPSL